MTGLKIASGLPDPTKLMVVNSSEHQGQEFPTALNARYGRLTIMDVGGNTGQKLTVPLQVEYWDGTQFVVNDDDSGSSYLGEAYCVQGVWPDASSSASLTTESVTRSVKDGLPNGSAAQLFATQSTGEREQVRLWLRSDDAIPTDLTTSNCNGSAKLQPWLNYKWRGDDKGDEIPSAVITFGTHRGNDRIIFRGEPRMTGQ